MRHPAAGCKIGTAGKQTKFWKKCTGIFAMLLFLYIGTVSAQAKAPEQVTKTVVVEQKIPFGTTYIDLQDVYKGYTKLVSEGVAGARKVEAQVIYEGDKPVKVLSITTTETGTPVPQVVQRGTKVLKSKRADGKIWSTSFAHPLKGAGWISADYYDYPGHNGVDFAAPYKTPVYAAAEGTVTLSGWYGEYGNCVILRHADGSETLYAHNSKLTVRNGQKVLQGEKIAEVGTTGNSTGNHLHMELRYQGKQLDPLVYIDQ
ncbi:MAG: peptidoglycan DD-metalloendopeptidase family protein [Anaerotruncus sp.]|jgi:murein DD-endopeptidase MepM/ murein hydrolase activator NlpD|nr:peptidoglycan DD-metalloendopeptidase family protein [Anaerotruncus sp.]